MTDEELNQIEARAKAAVPGPLRSDVEALIAEVRHLREEKARQHDILGACQGCKYNCECIRAAYRAIMRLY